MFKKFIYHIFRPFLAKKVKVLSVIDGDTFFVMDRAGNKFKVRLWAVDAPEMGQSAGVASKQFAQNVLQNSWVSLKHKAVDKYGRNVCKVLVNKKDLALLMIKAKQVYVLKEAPLSYKIAATLNPILFKQKPWAHRKKSKFWSKIFRKKSN